MNGRKVYEKISAAGYDCALFLDETSQHYLSDFYTTDDIVIVSREETALFADSRYFEAADSLKKAGKLSADVHPMRLKGNFYAVIADYFYSHGAKRVCVDPALVSVLQLQTLQSRCDGVEFGFMEDIVLEFRRVKTEAEIENIRAAQRITDLTFEHICGFINGDRTEAEVAAEMEYFMRRSGASGLAFDTIAVSGKKSSLPHGVPGDERLTKDSFFTMDFGAKYNGYCSDMTRTVVVGKASDEMKHVYNTVFEAQSEAMKYIRAGVSGRDADGVARKIIADAGYGEYFGHSLGHSLGLEIHENPRVSPASDDILVPGNIVTVEPGIYIPGKFGVRIENMVLVTENGCENLTASPRGLIEL